MTINKSSTTNRRVRSAAGQNPPNIALDVYRVVTSAAAVTDALSCCATYTENDLLPEMLAFLRRFLSESLEDVIVRAARDVASVHGCEHVDVEVLTAEVRTAMGRDEVEGNLDEVIAKFVARGIDGERVTWDVIGRESLNHEGLIFKECNRLLRTLPNRTVDELRGYGWAGLRTALRKFDVNLGYAFSTYACPRINGAIRDGVRAEMPIPKRLTTFLRKVSAAEEMLTRKLSRTPTYEEITASLQEAEHKVMHLLPRLSPAASIEEMSTNHEGERIREPSCLVEHADPMEEAMISLRDEALHAAIGQLAPELRDAVQLLMFDELSVREAAERVGVEPRRMSQRKAQALEALEAPMRAWYQETAPAVA